MKTKLLAILLLLGFTLGAEAQVSKTSLLVHYNMDGNGIDSSGNNLDATQYNMMGATDRFGKVGGAVYFNGVDGYMTLLPSSTIQPLDSISICVWVNQEQKPNTGWSTVIDKRYKFTEDPWSSYGIASHPTYNNRWMFRVSSGTAGSGVEAAAKNPNPYNTWTFIVATYNKNQVKLYINGILDSANSKTASIEYSGLGLLIGYSGTGPNEFFKGRMDDLRIYGRVLSQQEITTLYSATNALNEQEIKSDHFAIYPNPAKNSLHIESDQAWKQAAIYDMLGQLIWEGNFEHEIQVEQLETGNYCIRLSAENGLIANRRFVKQ